MNLLANAATTAGPVLLGLFLLWVVLSDTFETIVLPRTVARRVQLTKLFDNVLWDVWSLIARRLKPGASFREAFLGTFGPLSLLLIIVWLVGLVLAFALIFYGLRIRVNAPDEAPGFGTYLYSSPRSY